MKKLWLTPCLLAALLVLPLTACSGGSSGSQAPAPSLTPRSGPQLRISDGLTVNTFDDFGLKARIAVDRADAAAKAMGRKITRTLK